MGAARRHQDKPGKQLGAARFKENSSGQHLLLLAGLPDRNTVEGDADGAILHLEQEKTVILESGREEAKEPGSLSRSGFGYSSSIGELVSSGNQKDQNSV